MLCEAASLSGKVAHQLLRPLTDTGWQAYHECCNRDVLAVTMTAALDSGEGTNLGNS